ncbi:MAG: hypothetical protein IJP95_05510 [Bacteroidales bacterium]|nr:hypothetical protein [Bacteroidales bacterium]
MKRTVITLIPVLAAFVATTAMGANIMSGNNRLCCDTNFQKKNIRCPRCGETIPYADWSAHNSNSDDLETKIASFVDDLTDEQREQLHQISVKSKQTIHQLRNQLRELHDTIRLLLKDPADQSEKLFPLFDLSAQLRAQKDKELYMARIGISKVLTKEQLQTLRQKMAFEKKSGAQQNKKIFKKLHNKQRHRRKNKAAK